jgi:hypothetical protein
MEGDADLLELSLWQDLHGIENWISGVKFTRIVFLVDYGAVWPDEGNRIPIYRDELGEAN